MKGGMRVAEINLQALFCRIANGDREAFSCVYQELKRPVYTICYRITGSKESAEDITHDVFVKLFMSPPAPSVQNIRAWIFRMARNLAIDALRKKAYIAEEDESVVVEDAYSQAADPGNPPADAARLLQPSHPAAALQPVV